MFALLCEVGVAAEFFLRKGGADMKLRQRVRVSIYGPGGGEKAMLVFPPAGMTADSAKNYEVRIEDLD